MNPNSGAVDNLHLKGDCRTDKFLFECKATSKKSISVNLSDVLKAKEQSKNIGKKYIMDLEFQEEDTTQALESLVLIRRADFLEFYEAFIDRSNDIKDVNDKLEDISLQYFIENIVNMLPSEHRTAIHREVIKSRALGQKKYDVLEWIK